MGSIFGIDINKSLDPFSGSFGETGEIQGPQAAAEDPGLGLLAGFPVDPGLEQYSWKGLYESEQDRIEEREQEKAAAAAEAERIRPKTEGGTEGLVDYSELQKTVKQMQGVKGQAINPDVMEAIISGSIQAQVAPAIEREEAAMDREIQQQMLDIDQERWEEEQEMAESSGILTGVLGGAIIGTEVSPGWGTVIGGVLGGAGASSIICTELNRQDLLDMKTIKRATFYRMKYMDKEVYIGYLIWAAPIVRLMRSSALTTKIVKSFWNPLTYELAARSEGKKGNMVGKIALSILIPFSKMVYKLRAREVCCG